MSRRARWITRLGAVALVLVLAFTSFLLPGIAERSMNKVRDHAPYVTSVNARRLHETLFVADLHADSLLWKRNLLKRSRTGHVDVPRLREGNVALQVFSATTKSPSGQNYASNTADSDNITRLAVLSFWPPRTWNSLFERARFQLQKLNAFASQSNGQLAVIRTRGDLQTLIDARAAGQQTVGGLFLIEGAHPLEGDIDKLARLFEEGVRIAGLTHFFDNELGGSLHGISGDGLSEFGKEVIRRADELGLIIDVAHSSPAMVRDVLALSDRPVMISHGGIKGACDTKRNLSDDLMRQIAAGGGLLGIGFWDAAVCDASPAGIVRSIRYAIDTLGLEHVALGSDFDGAVETALDSSELAILTHTMIEQGFSEQEIRAVMGENVKRFLLENLPE